MKNFWKELKKPFTVLAPMEDVTDVVFRQVVAECGRPDVFFTEFMSTDGFLSAGKERVAHRLIKKSEESPIVAQIWGNKPDNFYKAAKQIVEMGFDGIDINMGCPVKKITKQIACSRLIDYPDLAAEIIKATQEGIGGKIPLSVKTRLGYKIKKTEEWCGFLLDQDIQALTVHGRLAKDMSKFPADWDEIKKVVDIRNKKKLETIIIGNGDVADLEDVERKYNQTGVDGLMIGRGVFKDPFVFNPNRSIKDLSVSEKCDLLLRHFHLFIEIWGNTKKFVILRRFFKIYLSEFEGASDAREMIMRVENPDEVVNVVNEIRKKYGP